MPLGSRLGPSEAVLDSLGPLANAGFRCFEVLDGRLGPILALLGPILSQNGTPKLPQMFSKSNPKIGHKMDPKFNQTNILMYGRDIIVLPII